MPREPRSDPKHRPTIDRWLVCALLLFLALGFWYSMVVPPFETPDEHYHYGFSRHLAQGNPLPVQSAEATGPWEQEGSQAPLYYMLVGWLTAGIDQSDFEQISRTNQRANIGDPLSPGNKNRMLYSAMKSCLFRCGGDHQQLLTQRPLSGTNLAVHVGRWLSLFLGGTTLWFLYATAKLAFPHRHKVWILAIFIVATLPQFAFISASLSNDSMIITASAATIYWLAHLLTIEQQKRISAIDWLILGLLLGIAALSKLQGLGLWLLAALVGLWLSWQRRDWTLPLRAILPVALPALAICGWWYWRNYTLYGDWLGIANLLEINGRRDELPGMGSLWGEIRGLRYSFWGLFGWFNILLPDVLYQLLDALTLIALIGLIPALRQIAKSQSTKRASTVNLQVLLLLLTWALLSLVLIVYWSSQAVGSQGRLLFPGITAFVLLLALGLSAWPDLLRKSGLLTKWPLRGMPRLSNTIAVALPVLLPLLLPLLLLVSSLYALTVLLPNAYTVAAPIDQLPPSAQVANIRYGDPTRHQKQLHLLGLEVGQEVGQERYRPGDQVPVTLYLSAGELSATELSATEPSTAERVQDDYQLFIQFLNDTGEPIANLTTHPGWGRNPTTLWRSGAIYADQYLVPIDQPIDPRSPLLARVYVGFVNPETEKTDRLPLDAFDAAGEQIVPTVQTVVVRPSQPPTIDEFGLTAVDIQFDDGLRLIGYSALDTVASDAITVSVQLMWEATAEPQNRSQNEYIAYVHLIDESGEQIAGFDQPPAAGRFPTAYWQEEDRIISEFDLMLPTNFAAGTYEMWVGLYTAESAGTARVAVVDAGEMQTQDNQVLIQSLMVVE